MSQLTTPVNEQQRVVLLQMAATLEEHFKLLQMLYIRRLEGQVQYLQSQLDT